MKCVHLFDRSVRQENKAISRKKGTKIYAKLYAVHVFCQFFTKVISRGFLRRQTSDNSVAGIVNKIFPLTIHSKYDQ